MLLLLSACAGPMETSGPYGKLDAPMLVASGDGIDAAWTDLVRSAATVSTTDEPADIPGFEPFNDPRISLADGRLLVRGRSDADEPIAGWHRRNPALVPEGEESPVIEDLARPIRLFVYDPTHGTLLPVSHIPDVRAYTTAATEGESPDVVLDVVVLEGEQVVAYTSGFNGAAYDIPYEVWVAPIPEG